MNTTVFNSKTLVPIGLVACCLITVIGACVGAAIEWHSWSVEDHLWKSRIEYTLSELRRDSMDRWSRADQHAWRDRLSDLNKDLNVPPIPEPRVVRSDD